MLLRIHAAISSIFSSRSPSAIFSFCLATLVLLGWLDHNTGNYSLIVFYVIPVSLMAWFVTRRAGILFCVLSLATRILSDTSIGFGEVQSHYSKLHYWNIFIEFLFLLIMSMLFSALRKTLDSEKNRASTDSLTGALNRRSFFELAEHELKRARRYDLPLTLAYIDLDNFKEINDHLGHSAGDELLSAVVATISRNTRSTDILARLGGDEFVLLLPETGYEPSGVLLEKIREQLLQTMKKNHWQVTFSIGAVTHATAPADVDAVVSQADMLMYQVKHSGKNRLYHIEAQETTDGQG